MNEPWNFNERHARLTRMNKEIEVPAQGEELLLFEWYTQHSKAEQCPVFSRSSGFRGTSQTLRVQNLLHRLLLQQSVHPIKKKARLPKQPLQQILIPFNASSSQSLYYKKTQKSPYQKTQLDCSLVSIALQLITPTTRKGF